MNDTEAPAPATAHRRGPIFTEKAFYLEEFYGKSLLFALVPPIGNRLVEFDGLVKTLRDLRRNQTRCIVVASAAAMPKLTQRMGRLKPRGEVPRFNPSSGLRTRPYPPDSSVAEIWRRLRAGSRLPAAAVLAVAGPPVRSSLSAAVSSPFPF